jgi:hypothetical protein
MNSYKERANSTVWCLMSVIPVTKEAEIRRIAVQGQPQATSSGDHILKKAHHRKGLVEWLKL